VLALVLVVSTFGVVEAQNFKTLGRAEMPMPQPGELIERAKRLVGQALLTATHTPCIASARTVEQIPLLQIKMSKSGHNLVAEVITADTNCK